jgi:hypothetical protein
MADHTEVNVKSNLVKEFIDITMTEDSTAIHYLENCQWNVTVSKLFSGNPVIIHFHTIKLLTFFKFWASFMF